MLMVLLKPFYRSRLIMSKFQVELNELKPKIKSLANVNVSSPIVLCYYI